MKTTSRLFFFLLFSTLLLSGCGPAGMAQTADPQAGGGRINPAQQIPTPAGTMIPIQQPLRPGTTTNQAGLSFNLTSIQTRPDVTVVEYQVKGLPKSYAPSSSAGEPWLILLDGSIISMSSSGGSGADGLEATHLEGAALPGEANGFTLVIPNNWSGAVQTWFIPVRINP